MRRQCESDRNSQLGDIKRDPESRHHHLPSFSLSCSLSKEEKMHKLWSFKENSLSTSIQRDRKNIRMMSVEQSGHVEMTARVT